MIPYRFAAQSDKADKLLSKYSDSCKTLADFEFYEINYNNKFLYVLKSTKENYMYGSNRYRADIWWLITKLFPNVKSKDVIIGWTNMPEPFYESFDNSATTKNVCFEEFSILLEWIQEVVESTKRKQKIGGLKNEYKSWFGKRKRDISRTDT